MKKRIILIPKDDLILYPPTLSLINVLLDLGIKVICVGTYTDPKGKAKLEQQGVEFVPIYLKIKDVSHIRVVNWAVIIWRMMKYKRSIRNFFTTFNATGNELVWFIYSSSIAYIQNYIEKFPYVVQFYEFENYSIDGKSRLLHLSYDVNRFLNQAKALIHCEYNRAMITNGLYGLNKEVVILPNKPYDNNTNQMALIPPDIEKVITEVRLKTSGKKIILYQGIFNAYERRLDEFCEAVSLLPPDFVFVALGGPGDYFELIKKKFTSERLLFVPFVRPPYHLHITKMARYGVLTYHPAGNGFVNVLNPLYCAPNKIFEFGKFGIPMIANDVPGLKMIFESYKCGSIVSMPITSQKIAETILSMENMYDELSNGSRSYYDSVNIEEIVKKVIEC